MVSCSCCWVTAQHPVARSFNTDPHDCNYKKIRYWNLVANATLLVSFFLTDLNMWWKTCASQAGLISCADYLWPGGSVVVYKMQQKNVLTNRS